MSVSERSWVHTAGCTSSRDRFHARHTDTQQVYCLNDKSSQEILARCEKERIEKGLSDQGQKGKWELHFVPSNSDGKTQASEVIRDDDPVPWKLATAGAIASAIVCCGFLCSSEEARSQLMRDNRELSHYASYCYGEVSKYKPADQETLASMLSADRTFSIMPTMESQGSGAEAVARATGVPRPGSSTA
ncbi:uncharacterized protein L199_000075 [Kwoniella botswanensis]|uniref:uncharacterized protein n=1 Tax=Kwoniella botswanensis TaxID=1268659 RepID=UPI00315CC930